MKYNGHISKIVYGTIEVEAANSKEAKDMIYKAVDDEEKCIPNANAIDWHSSEVSDVTTEII